MSQEQNAQILWNKIIFALQQSPQETVTILQNGTKGKWFLASVHHANLLIQDAKINKPAVHLSMDRTITKTEFLRTYPYYHGWRKEEPNARQEAQETSRNTSYIFALIAKFE